MQVTTTPATPAQLAAQDQADRERKAATLATAGRLGREAEAARNAAAQLRLASEAAQRQALANPTPQWLAAARLAASASELADEAAEVAAERAHDARTTARLAADTVRRNEARRPRV